MVALSYRIKMNSIFPERLTNDRDFNMGKKNIFKFAIYGGVDTFDLRGGGLPSFLVQIFQFFGCMPN